MAETEKVAPRAVLILGAGRSGTSIVARATQAIGVDLGDDFKPPSRKNPTGFFEDAALLALSKKLRRALGLRPDSLRLLDETVWDGPVVAPFYDEFSRVIEARFSGSPVWGFKYARTMRLLPFWVRLFDGMGIEPSYVMPVRNPLSVARSRARLDRRRGTQENSDLEWLTNVVPWFDLVRDRPLVVVDYDRLVSEPVRQLGRMADRLCMPVDDRVQASIETFASEFLSPGLQHTRFTLDDLMASPDIHRLLKAAYRLLDRLATDDLDSGSQELWDEWRGIRDRLLEYGPVLRQIDSLNRDLRHARWNPLSSVPALVDLLKRLARNLPV